MPAPQPANETASLDLLRDVQLDLKIELGRTQMHLEDVLRLKQGAVVTLDKLAGDPVDIYANGRLIARGEVLVLNDNFCVRVAELIAGDDAAADVAVLRSIACCTAAAMRSDCGSSPVRLLALRRLHLAPHASPSTALAKRRPHFYKLAAAPWPTALPAHSSHHLFSMLVGRRTIAARSTIHASDSFDSLRSRCSSRRCRGAAAAETDGRSAARGTTGPSVYLRMSQTGTHADASANASPD